MKILDKYKEKYGFIFLMALFVTCFLAVAFVSKANEGEDETDNEAVNDEYRINGYSAVLYNGSNGLPTSEANVVAQTGDGFIWIGGYSGLIRYDGNEFYRYDATTGITSVVSMYVDSNDRLWIGTNDSGAALYDKGSFKFISQEDGMSSGSVKSISEDGDGCIFLATTEGLYYVDEEMNLCEVADKRINSAYICEIKNDKAGNVYGVTLDGVLFMIEDETVTAYCTSQNAGFTLASCICPDEDNPGMLYVGTDASEIVYGDIKEGMKNYKEYNVSPLATINAVSKYGDGFWICSDTGIGYLNNDGSFSMLEDVPMDNSVDEMLIDYEGNLWFASSRQGVMKVAKCRFENINLVSNLPNIVVNSTCVYKESLYIGADDGLYIVNSNYKEIQNKLTRLLAGVRIRCIKEDSQGNLWLCTYSEHGLVCLTSDGEIKEYNEENGMRSNRVRTMIEMSDGTIVVSTSGGVHLIKDGEIESVYDSGNGISNTEILCVCEGTDGAIYLGSDGDGIYKVSENNAIHFGKEDGLNSEVILRIKEDSKGEGYWIITGNSLAYMENDSIRTISHFPYSNNFDIFFDAYDRVWILSSNGIYVVSREELLKDDENIEYVLYDFEVGGLPCNPVANSRSYISPEGNLYISGSTGVTRVYINQKDASEKKPKLAVPFMDFDDEAYYLEKNETVKVPKDIKRLTIHAYVLSFSLDSAKVSYYLEGFDEEPTIVDRQDLSDISYTNLPGGKYTFHLAVVDNFTEEKLEEITVEVIKERKLNEYIWFWIAIIGACVVAILVISNRINAAKIKAEKEQFLEKQRRNNEFTSQMIAAFAKSIDIKDKYTNGHSFRVAKYSKLLAKKLEFSEEETENVYRIAMLHDIGKLNVPDEILNKPEKLTDEEFDTIKQHASNGYEILKEIKSMPDLALGAGYHHEKIDGTGYPNGKKGSEIPYVARIIAVADTFDAMNSNRPYRKHLGMEAIKAELNRVRNTQLESDIVDALLELIDDGEITANENE